MRKASSRWVPVQYGSHHSIFTRDKERIFDQNVPKDSCSFGCTDSLLDELCIIHLLIHLQSLRCMSKEFYTLKVQPLKDLPVMSVSCATGFFGTQA